MLIAAVVFQLFVVAVSIIWKDSSLRFPITRLPGKFGNGRATVHFLIRNKVQSSDLVSPLRHVLNGKLQYCTYCLRTVVVRPFVRIHQL
jgi:hypothetical protein